MALLNPLALAGLALAIPIVLLYMLRLRRREMPVSSTFLWQQVVRDREANTPWQRLRRNLLLLLQLLVLLALVLALARPFVWVPAVSSGAAVLLLDASASMNARDMPEGTRFDAARARAREIVGTLGGGDSLSIVRVGANAEVVIAATDDRQRLLAAIDSAAPGTAGADWAAALTLAAAAGEGAASLSIVIISDGGGALQSGTLPDVPGEIRYIPVGAESGNLAITALAARAQPGETPQLFAQVANTGPAEADAIFSLRLDGVLVQAERVRLPAGSSLPIVASPAAPFTTASASLTLPAEADPAADRLADDDAAFAVADARTERAVVLIGPGNTFLEGVLRALPGVSLTRAPAGTALTRAYDVIVLDGGTLPDPLPAGDVIAFAPTADSRYWALGPVLQAADAARPTRDIQAVADPRTAYVDVSAMQLRQFRAVDAPWGRPLITAAGGPLLLVGETGDREIALFTFALQDSDLPLQIAFPILMNALVEQFTPSTGLETGSVAVGDAVGLRLAAETTDARIVLPDGSAVTLAPGDRLFTQTDRPGLYRLEAAAGERPLHESAFAVNLFLPEESAIAPYPTLRVGGGAPIAPAPAETTGQLDLWPWVAAAALAVLVFEWWAYHRRAAARPLFPRLGRTRVLAHSAPAKGPR